MTKMSETELYTRLSRARLEHRAYNGSQWKHVKSGNLYTINAVAYQEADMSLVVVYAPHDAGVMFTRPLTEFVERFVPTRV